MSAPSLLTGSTVGFKAHAMFAAKSDSSGTVSIEDIDTQAGAVYFNYLDDLWGELHEILSGETFANTGSFYAVTASLGYFGTLYTSGDVYVGGGDLFVTGTASQRILVSSSTDSAVLTLDSAVDDNVELDFNTTGSNDWDIYRGADRNLEFRRWNAAGSVADRTIIDHGNGDWTFPAGIYLAGAEEGDGAPDAGDLVIGDGSASPGMTLFADANGVGRYAITDVAGAQHGELRYDLDLARWQFEANGTHVANMNNAAIWPQADDDIPLGTSNKRWSDVFAITGSFSAISGSSQAFHGLFTAGNEDQVFIPWTGQTERTTANGNDAVYYTPCNVVVESITLRTSVTGDHAVGIYNLPGLSGAPDQFLIGHITQSINNGNPPQTIYIDGNPNLSGSNHVPANRSLGLTVSGTTAMGYTIRLRHDWTT